MMMQRMQATKLKPMTRDKSIFITGGAGYIGSRLVPQLIKSGYKVTVYDIMYFGFNFLPNSKNLQITKVQILL